MAPPNGPSGHSAQAPSVPGACGPGLGLLRRPTPLRGAPRPGPSAHLGLRPRPSLLRRLRACFASPGSFGASLGLRPRPWASPKGLAFGQQLITPLGAEITLSSVLLAQYFVKSTNMRGNMIYNYYVVIINMQIGPNLTYFVHNL